MSGIDYDRIKSFSRVFDPCSRNGTAGRQRSDKSDGNKTSDLARHSDLIAKNTRSTKFFCAKRKRCNVIGPAAVY